MRVILTILLSVCSIVASAQQVEELQKMGFHDYPEDALYPSFIYGSVARSMFDTSCVSRDVVWLYQEETDVLWSFYVKPMRRKVKNHRFCYSIPPGRYAVLGYSCIRDCSSGGALSSLNRQLYTWWLGKDGQWSENDRRYMSKKRKAPLPTPIYYITIEKGKTYYIGKWLVDEKGISFIDDKQHLDEIMKIKVPELNYDNAVIALPSTGG